MSPARKKIRLGRRPREDRDAVRSQLVQIKLTPPEAAALDRIVAAREIETSAATGGGRVVLSRSSVLRELLDAEAKRRGLVDAEPTKESEGA